LIRHALRFEAVSRRYGLRGPKALDAFSCHFPRGAVSGLVGPNGAGKTTAFSVACGFLRPDSGYVDVLGEGPFDPWKLKGRLGVLPQDAELGDRHTPRELLAHLAALQGLARSRALHEADRVLDQVLLSDRRDKGIRTLSHGMRRRVAVATALVGAPELVLLDEPTAGLDPVQARALRDTLAALRGSRTLVISSHNLDELERLSDHVVVLDRGRCLQEGALATVTHRAQRVEWILGPGPAPLADLEAALPGHTFELRGPRLLQWAPPDADLDGSSVRVMEILASHRVPLVQMRRGTSLEETVYDGLVGTLEP